MSQPAPAGDPFVPFDPVPGSAPARSSDSPGLKVVSRSETTAAFSPLAASGPAHAHVGKPQVTLQREGDRVASIRIECTCGQVIELACSY